MVRLSVPPVEGKANEQLVEIVAKHFGVAKSLVHIVSGQSSRVKTLEIAGNQQTTHGFSASC
jgi:uncharacterized protein (TIGR00251 family)